MNRWTRTSLAAAVVLVAALAVPITATPEQTTGNARVIVELTAPPALAVVRADGSRDRAREYGVTVLRAQDAVLGQADETGLDVDVVHRLTAAYSGLVVDVPADQVQELAGLDGVRAVHPDASYALALEDSVPLVGAPEAWDTTAPDGRAVTGTGITVAVLDSGIDYSHPDLGGGFGPDHKVVAGYDLVNDDADPMDDNGHGTHVAGIVAADGAVRGVAPGATLTAYKVMNSSGNGQLSDIIAGLDAAVAPDNPHRADVVNLSLSGPGDGTDPLSTAVRSAVEAGVVVTVSAGNAGPGAHSVQSPAAADGALAVGASTSGVWVPRARMVAPGEQDLRAVRAEVSAAAPADPLRVAVVDVGEGRPADYEGVDVTDKAVLVIDDGDAFGLAAAAEARGAAAALIYTPDFWRPRPAAAEPVAGAPTTDPAPSDEFTTGMTDDGRVGSLVALRIPGASAATLQSHLSEKVEIEITGGEGTDLLADFSSRGPTARFTAKPDLVAPGVEILSTLPGQRHGRASGTSMAAPHVAGAAALVRQRHPDWTPAQVGAALAGTARPLRDDAGPLAQGAGRLDVSRAVDAEVLATPTTLSFGLADLDAAAQRQLTGTARLTLENLGTQTTPLGLTATVTDGAGTVTVEPAELSLTPGGTGAVTVRLTADRTTADTDVSGWVEIEGHGRVPFLLSARHLTVHVTPDPVPVGAQTSLYVSSPAPLASPPVLEVTCPGLEPRRPELAPHGTGSWHATMTVADAGRCDATVTGTATSEYGAAGLTGAAAFEVAAPVTGRTGVSTWQQIGPSAEAGWLAFDAGRDRRRTAVVPLGSPSVFVTEDRMRTWRELRTMPMSGGSAADVEVDPRGSGAMYVAMNGGAADPSYEGRIVHTADGGGSWRVLPGWDRHIDELALDPTGRALVVSGGGMVRITHDDGATWAELPSIGANPRDLHWIGPDVYAATNSGLVVIRDALGPAPSRSEVVYRPGVLGWAGRVAGDTESIFVTAYPSAWVYASHDGGATFQLVLQSTGSSFQALDLVGDTLYGISGTGTWVGRDRGARWEQWGDPMPPSVEFDIGGWPGTGGDLYVASSGAGIYRAGAPGEFERVGIPAARVYDLAIAQDATGPVLVAGTYRDTFRTPLTGGDSIRPADLEWESGGEGLFGVAAEYVAVSSTDPSVVYKVSKDPVLTFSIQRSSDGGATWERVSQPSEFPHSLLVHPADPDRVYAGYSSLTGAGLVVSEDGGGTWRKLDQGRVFRALAGDPADPQRIWAGDHEGLYRSDDGGVTFERLADVPVTAIAADPDEPGHLTVGGRTLYTSADGGETLVPADTPGLDMWVTDLLYEPGPGRRVFASAGSFYDEFGVVESGRGVLVSGDGGASWTSMSAGLSNSNVTSLALDQGRRHLYAGTFGGSVHRIKLPN
ncbi:S8 family serine peptidase [Jiangella endophytica]|uniref:S8 family serine peptidase n=1 Tax=Jiangella endophytica TaxID=1623398 RepID=UPI0018E566BE|nr:S8 family serine peptidase [Jiangella endophytica]